MYLPSQKEILQFAGREMFLYLNTCSISTLLLKQNKLRRRVLTTLGALFNEAMLENLDRMLPLNWQVHPRLQRIYITIDAELRKSINDKIEKFDLPLRTIRRVSFVEMCKKLLENITLLPILGSKIASGFFMSLPALRSKHYIGFPSEHEKALHELGFMRNFFSVNQMYTSYTSQSKLHDLKGEKIYGLVTINVEKYVALLLQILLPQKNEVILVIRNWKDAMHSKLRRTLLRSKYLHNFTASDDLLPFPCEIYHLK